MFKMTIPVGTPLYFAVVDLPPRRRNAEINQLAALGFRAKQIVKDKRLLIKNHKINKRCSFKISISDPDLNHHLLSYSSKARNIEFYRFATEGLFVAEDGFQSNSEQIENLHAVDKTNQVMFGSDLFDI